MSEQTEANYEEWYRAMFFRALNAEEQVAALREELRVAKAERDALGEALEKERAKTCDDCGKELAHGLKLCTGCTYDRVTALRASVTRVVTCPHGRITSCLFCAAGGSVAESQKGEAHE